MSYKLQNALDYFNEQMLKKVLRNEPDINIPVGSSKLAPLSYVLHPIDDSTDPHRVVKLILNEAKKRRILADVVNKKDYMGGTAILGAILNDFNKSKKLILDTGVCDLTITDEEGHTVAEMLNIK